MLISLSFPAAHSSFKEKLCSFKASRECKVGAAGGGEGGVATVLLARDREDGRA